MITDRHNNRARGVRSFTAASSDCSAAGTEDLRSPSKSEVRAGLLHKNASLRQTGCDLEPVPIWFAALLASRCRAEVDGKEHGVRWICIAGRALYTNQGSTAERIEPLGVQLPGGHTVAVYWRPGETNYTVEIYSQANHFRA
jgi:hypothetical protein